MNRMGVANVGADAQGTGIIVAVLDTGINRTLNDRPVNILQGYDFVDNDNDPFDSAGSKTGHGTHVAGTIAGATNNTLGVRGVAPGATILPVRVCGPNGCPGLAIAQGIDYAVAQGADVINLSLGGGGYSSYMAAVYADAIANGVVIVAATGNDGRTNQISYPALYSGIIAVGSVGMNDNIAYYSDRKSVV